jgi:soluble lytic murein transglycosylase-like protein
MRSRMALILVTYAVGFAAALTILFSVPGASPTQEKSSWNSSHTHIIRQATMLLTADDLQPLAAYAAAVVQAQTAAAQTAAQSSSSTASPAPTSPPTSTTPTPESYSGSDNSAIWNCIIERESGGNPTIYNESGSGASGLVQFMPGTWGGYDGYANAADAPAAVQMQRAYQVEAEDGWSPWRGDGCTPDG